MSKKPSVRYLLRKAADERGRENEARALAALQSVLPQWAKSARAAVPAEDKLGADIVINSDVGRLYLQVKSSQCGARVFNAENRRIMVQVVVVNCDDATLNERVLRAAEMARRAVMKVRAKRAAKEG